jgi:hypothetical protein
VAENLESSMVFVDADNGDEESSIEVVNQNHQEEDASSNDTKREREDILQVCH